MIGLNLELFMQNEAFKDALINAIVDEVMRRLQNRPKKALVCFSGAAIGFTEVLENLVALKSKGWELTLFASEGAKAALPMEHIQKTLKIDKIYDETDTSAQINLFKDKELMILATTTVNTAAKLALGICDNAMTTLINHGLMAGIPTICVKDGADPDNAVRSKLGGDRSSPAYRQMMVDHLQKLEDFGIDCCEAKDLAQVCQHGGPIVQTKPQAAARDTVTSAESTPGHGQVRLVKNLITRSDIMENSNVSLIEVTQNAIVTEFAKDAAMALGIQIKKF